MLASLLRGFFSLPSAGSLSCRVRFTMQASKRQRTMIEVRRLPELTKEEQRIFGKLLDVVSHYQLGTQLRVAGGWVRDKLLGKECHDIDIALDNMVGVEFCNRVNEYLRIIGEEPNNVGVIMSNPDQSKHLETATMRVNGLSLDFVNLRAETYAEESRIPKMKFGTPRQDAERRDLTINSLFYNINTGQVEDFTGRGIPDLASGRIATPLEPKVTFLDDPLRVLRSVRFAARFDFELAEDLKVAAASEEVRSALIRKITKERIGNEVELMLLGNGTATAMRLLLDLKLFSIVFSPPSISLFDGWERMCVEHMEAGLEVLQTCAIRMPTEEHKRVFMLSCLLYPLKDLTYTDKKNKVFPCTSFIIKESLKRRTNDSQGVLALHRAVRGFVNLAVVLLSGGSSIPEGRPAETWEGVQRIEAGLLVIEMKDSWRSALLLSLLDDFKDKDIWDVQEKAKLYHDIEENIVTEGLDKAWQLKPLVDTKTLMEDLSVHGPAVKEWKELAIQWQLAHPSGAAEECRQWMKQEQSRLKC